MKKRKIILLSIAIIILIPVLMLLIEKLYALYYNKSYPSAEQFTKQESWIMTKVPVQGKIDFHFSQPPVRSMTVIDPTDTIMPETITSSIYLDTINNHFKISTKYYVGNNNEGIDYTTFDLQGKVLQVDQFIPKENKQGYFVHHFIRSGTGKLIQHLSDVKTKGEELFNNCILIKNLLPPFPKWKDKDGPVYIRHFLKQKFNSDEINPFLIGGINGHGRSSLWYGLAYCDVTIGNDQIKLKLPFGSDSTLFDTGEYSADLHYYALPKVYEQAGPLALMISDNQLYVIHKAAQ